MYVGMTIVYGLLGFVFTPLWFAFYPLHCAFIVFVLLFVCYNGATFYMDVFGPRSFK